MSILIVDTADPGFSWTPIITHDGAHHVNATYYSAVRVPVTRRVGEENAGWRLITAQLNHERVMLGPSGRIGVLHRRVRDWAARQTGPDGRPLLDQPDVRRALARASAAERVNELLNWQVAVAETVDIADASVTKVFGSEQVQRLGTELAELVGRHGDLAEEQTAELRPVAGRAEQAEHGPDLRRRSQRGAAGADRDGRAGAAAGAAMTAGQDEPGQGERTVPPSWPRPGRSGRPGRVSPGSRGIR